MHDYSKTLMARWLAPGIVAAAVVLFLALHCVPPEQRLYPECLVHRWTGFHCAGCGATRALWQLSRGALVAALHLNAPAVLVVTTAVLHALASCVCRLCGRRWLPWPRIPWKLAVAVVSAVLLFGVLRNVPMPPFCWLAPG